MFVDKILFKLSTESNMSVNNQGHEVKCNVNVDCNVRWTARIFICLENCRKSS